MSPNRGSLAGVGLHGGAGVVPKPKFDAVPGRGEGPWEQDLLTQCQGLLGHPLFAGVEAARKQERGGAWREWAEEAVSGSARAGHRYTAEPTVRVLRTVRGDDGQPSACSQAVADAYGVHYAELWGASAERGPRPCYDAAAGQAGRLTADDLRQAARGYSRTTAIGVDGFAMQHFGLMSDLTLDMLGVLFQAMEDSGQIPTQWDAINMALLPKATGGHRTIGLFVAPVRLWAKARRPLCEAWEADHERDYWGDSQGQDPPGPSVEVGGQS